MIFLQVPNSDEIAQDVDKTLNGLQTNWTHFWKMFIDSPVDALKFLGQHAMGIAIKIVIALVIFYVGRWLIKQIRKLIEDIFNKRKADSSVRIFIANLVSIVLWILLIVIIIDVFDIPLTGFVAIFAASAFAIGMALNGTLSNFAGGVLILLHKPYRVGDYIEAQGYGGTVRAIRLFSTLITTPDNKTVIMPNGQLSTNNVNNFSREANRRIEWRIGISYGDDFDKAAKVISGILDSDSRVIRDLGRTIAIVELAANSVNIVVRCWVNANDTENVFFDMNRRFYAELPANGIQFPFNQMDVHITNAPAAPK